MLLHQDNRRRYFGSLFQSQNRGEEFTVPIS